jgi:concanavalin A-like lectin/glucanase superfamily protein
MARRFNGVDQFGSSASPIDLSAYSQISISLWLWWDSFANDDDVAMDFGDSGGGPAGFVIDPNDSGSAVWAAYSFDAGVTNLEKANCARPSPAAWHHIVVNIDRTLGAASAVTKIYFDGIDQGATNGGGDSSGNFGSAVLYLMSVEGTSLFGAGCQAEPAIYGGMNLSPTDVSNLWNGGAGQLATKVQGSSLKHYWRMKGDISPEPALVGGIDLNLTGSPPKADHPFTYPLILH